MINEHYLDVNLVQLLRCGLWLWAYLDAQINRIGRIGRSHHGLANGPNLGTINCNHLIEGYMCTYKAD